MIPSPPWSFGQHTRSHAASEFPLRPSSDFFLPQTTPTELVQVLNDSGMEFDRAHGIDGKGSDNGIDKGKLRTIVQWRGHCRDPSLNRGDKGHEINNRWTRCPHGQPEISKWHLSHNTAKYMRQLLCAHTIQVNGHEGRFMEVDFQSDRRCILKKHLFHTIRLKGACRHHHYCVIRILDDGVLSIVCWDWLLYLSPSVCIIHSRL